ncbi:hypothetical protein [Peribacillus alkalitolerans]|nr:hypothetical protein [Peribacillus alkalitolerans]
MNLTKATKQQLYHIAKDETARMRDRYAAARELQKRRNECDKPTMPKSI